MAEQLISTTVHEKLPDSYVRSEAERPRLDEVVPNANIPVVDLANPDRATVVSQIDAACRSHGFFQVLNHGLPVERMRAAMAVANDFFRLSPEEKTKLYSDDPAKKMRLSTSFNVRKETVHNWRDYLRLHCQPLEQFVPDWPTNPPPFRAMLRMVIDPYDLAKLGQLLAPVDYTFEVPATSADKVRFVVPAVFTVGPGIDNLGCVSFYIELTKGKLLGALVEGLIEGATGKVAASMTMDEIFHDGKSFKEAVLESAQEALYQFGGLGIYSANVKQAKVDPVVAEVREGMYDRQKTMEEGMAGLYGKRKEADGLAATGDEQSAYLKAMLGRKYPGLPEYLNVADVNFDDGSMPDLESQLAHFVQAGGSKGRLANNLWRVGLASLYVGVCAGMQLPASAASFFASHQAAYKGLVAVVMGAVPVEVATAFWLPRSRSRRFHAFAEILYHVGVFVLVVGTAVGGIQITLKA